MGKFRTGGAIIEEFAFEGVLEDALQSCYIQQEKILPLKSDILKLCQRYGLDASGYGGAPCPSRKNEHLLQICIRRTLVDKLVYAAKPSGRIDAERQPISSWLNSN